MTHIIRRAEQLAPLAGPAARDEERSSAKARFFAGLPSTAMLVAFGTLAAVGLLIGLLPGWKGVSITSGSMGPGVVKGDLVLVNDAPPLIRVGQIVTYTDPVTGGMTTHRVVALESDGAVTTKGDANTVHDPIAVSADDIVGAGRFIVPFIGYPAYWVTTGNYLALALLLAVGAGMLHFARFAVSSDIDPWAGDLT